MSLRTQIRGWLAASALGLAVASGGCEEQAAEAPKNTCTGASQCPIGAVCRLPEGRCVIAPKDSFVGKFQCIIGDATTPIEQTGAGVSEVTGEISGSSYPLLTGATCTLRQVTPLPGVTEWRLYINLTGVLTGVSSNASMQVLMPAEQVEAPGRYDIYQADSLSADFSAALAHFDPVGQDSEFFAYSSHGYLLLDQVPSLGKPLSGYIAVKMHVTEGKARVGNLCPRGAADCGATSASNYVFCTPFGDHQLCTTFCHSDKDCQPLGGVCVGSACLAQCTSSDQCPQGTECSVASQDPAVPHVCLP